MSRVRRCLFREVRTAPGSLSNECKPLAFCAMLGLHIVDSRSTYQVLSLVPTAWGFAVARLPRPLVTFLEVDVTFHFSAGGIASA